MKQFNLKRKNKARRNKSGIETNLSKKNNNILVIKVFFSQMGKNN